ncbi:hypothetical protein M0802_010063 [Mischocyttarus mexicanus]|nr:hypothetical protein M0802_010063 [Mischocyttarus mexicanus]
MSDSSEEITPIESSTPMEVVVSDSTASESDPIYEKSSSSKDEKQYYPWTYTKITLKNDEYCNFNELIGVFYRISNTNLKFDNHRKHAISILKEISIRKLIGKKKRFPRKGIYVNLTTSIYGNLYRSILDAIDCQNNCNVEEQLIDCSCIDIFSLRLECALNLHLKIPFNEAYYYGIFTRKTFEKWHALKWL